MSFVVFKQQILELAQSGDIEKFLELINDNPSFSNRLSEIINKNGDTVVHLAARCGSKNIIEYCNIHCNRSILTQRNFDGKTPLHIASQYSDLPCVLYILSCNVPVDALKRSDWTPLMLACTKANLDIVKALLSHGSNPNYKNKDGWTPFHIACREGNLEIIKHLLKFDPLLWKTQSNNGRTALHTSALHGKVEVVKLLLSETSHDVDPIDSCGTIPLMDAISGNHNDIVETLINAGASVLKTDCLGRNVLHLAAEAGNLKCLEFLVKECNIDVNLRTDSGLTALHIAAKEKNLATVKKLLELNADYTIRDNKGRGVLDYSLDKNVTVVFLNLT